MSPTLYFMIVALLCTDAMADRTTTVQMDQQGRLYIPKAVRQSLGIENESATLQLEVTVIDD